MMYQSDIREALQAIALQTRKRYAAELRKIGLHIGQELALFHLWQDDGITQSDLKAKTGTQASTISNMLRKLEEDQVIRRKTDANDSRATRVFLTNKGKALKKPVEEIWHQHEAILFDGLTEDELLFMRRLLKVMEKNLSQNYN